MTTKNPTQTRARTIKSTDPSPTSGKVSGAPAPEQAPESPAYTVGEFAADALAANCYGSALVAMSTDASIPRELRGAASALIARIHSAAALPGAQRRHLQTRICVKLAGASTATIETADPQRVSALLTTDRLTRPTKAQRETLTDRSSL